ncbi:ABC transporter ATP-binding protein [Thalassotalea sp. ND16A]|uniref:ABC transporter ATP-binding protein n=1 Tax=Thalassotalea sp. ND16A TaxID=1535422 RepID=UPI000519FE8F|nr:ABC transporter ATP-binding protein [Thalassotalea sp. ND16A]KGK00632.1 Sulfate-transporting ATPase [Thalassotalea sp. ND16A]
MQVISVQHLVKHYKDVKAVDDISFTVNKGQCFGLLGPNGAGKTTTIEIMEGIIGATSGKVNYITESKNDVSQLIGIQFQSTALQDFLTVKETLALFAAFYENSVEIENLVKICDLTDFVDRDNGLLSGGQKQRLLLALALINDPEILFLDEPTTGLDPQSRRHFWQLIENIKAKNKTIILTTHYMDEAEQLCDDIVIMNKGKVIAQGSPKQLLNRHFKQVFIYLPIENISLELAKENNWHVQDTHVEIKTTNVEQTMKSLIELAIPLTGLHIKSANLDDLFLKLTGHSLEGETVHV